LVGHGISQTSGLVGIGHAGTLIWYYYYSVSDGEWQLTVLQKQ
jgi:hypothetical protein